VDIEEINMTWNGANKVSPDADYLYQQARRLVDQEEFLQAMTILSKAVEISPDFSQAFNELGICAENLNQYEDAVKYYSQAVHCDPTHADAWFNRGMSLKKIGREKDSQLIVERAIELYCGR